MKATEICSQAAHLVGGERDRQHGAKEQNFANIAKMLNAYCEVRFGPWSGETMPPALHFTPLDIGHIMVLFKLARTQSGAVNVDDYVDMAGYAGCAGEIATKESNLPPSKDEVAHTTRRKTEYLYEPPPTTIRPAGVDVDPQTGISPLPDFYETKQVKDQAGDIIHLYNSIEEPKIWRTSYGVRYFETITDGIWTSLAQQKPGDQIL